MADRHVPSPCYSVLLLATVVAVAGCGSSAVPPTRAGGSAGPLASHLALAVASNAPSAPAVPAASPTRSAMTPDAVITVSKPGWVAFDGTALWVYSTTGKISRIDTGKNTTAATLVVDPTWQDGGFAANDTGLWVTDFDTNLVYRIATAPLAVVATIPVGRNPSGVSAADGSTWVANHRGGSVSRIDLATNSVLATVKIGNEGPSGPQGLGVGLGSVWIGVPNVRAVFRIDAVSNRVIASIRTPAGTLPCGGLAIDAGAVWMTSCDELGTMVRIDPTTNTVAGTVNLHGYGGDPILIDGCPWLTVGGSVGEPAHLVRVDPASNAVDRVISLGDTFKGGSIVVAAGSLWVTDWANDRVLRLPLAALWP